MKKVPHREVVGALMYLSHGTRGDIAFAVNKIVRFVENPGLAHWKAAKLILRYLQGSKKETLNLKKEMAPLQAYSDSDWATDTEDRKSSTGYARMLAGGAVVWKSIKQKCVTASTMESEYFALSDCTKEIKWC